MALQSEADLVQTLIISWREEIAEGIFEFEFRHPSGDPLLEFTAGAHL